MKSDAAITALHIVLEALADTSTGVPTVHRNEPLEKAFEAVEDGAKAYANLIDGDIEVEAEHFSGEPTYELALFPDLELIVSGDTDPARRATMSTILNAVEDAIAADRTLAGAVASCRIERVRRQGLTTEDIPGVGGVLVRFRVEVTSNRPF